MSREAVLALHCLDALSVLCPAAGGRSWGMRWGLLGWAFMSLWSSKGTVNENTRALQSSVDSAGGEGGAVGRIWVLAPKCQ